jgi:hypothetical protein
MKPGPEIGRILKEIYEKQLDGEIDSTDAGIEIARTMIKG